MSAKFESVIETYPDKVIDGYKLDRATVPLTISATASQNVIDVYYVKDEFAYTIEYYKDGDTAPFATSNDLKAAFGSVITKASIADSIDANRPDGYTYSSDTAPLTITSTPSSNVIKVYYTKADYGYTIRYFKDGETDPFATSSGLTAAFGSVITKASITGSISANRPDGYKHSSDTAPLTIKSDAAENVIDVYYVKDSFSYTVEYYYDGVMDGDKTVTGTANFKDVIDSYTDKVIDGYKLDETNPVNIPLEISHDESKNVIKVYYVKDSFDYSVEYYYDGVIDSSKTVTGTANFKDVIEAYTDKVIDGYKLDEDEPGECSARNLA